MNLLQRSGSCVGTGPQLFSMFWNRNPYDCAAFGAHRSGFGSIGRLLISAIDEVWKPSPIIDLNSVELGIINSG